MNERLLHFIWQFRYFSSHELTTAAGEGLQLISVGQYNHNQGPDFLGARIRIGDTTWAGHVELHVRTSDWRKHRHTGDRNYGNVILHVVWEHDETPNEVPVLELKGRVPGRLLSRYRELLDGTVFIPCERMIGSVPDLNWRSWKDRLLAERLKRRAAAVHDMGEQNRYHWEEIYWYWLARSFGGPVNGPAFEEMAKSLSLKLLAGHKNQLQQLEALLFGQAGLLAQQIEGDDYYRLLQKEYGFLQRKYKLEPVRQPLHFLRMRPGNFPTVRLAQLAVLVQQPDQLFSAILDTRGLRELKGMFAVTANDYWFYHYRFGEPSGYRKKNLGTEMMDTIIINAVAPLLYAYGEYHQAEKYKAKALQWLEETAAEMNAVTRRFRELGLSVDTAFDSQALIELKNEYCNQKKCLDCGVGNAILGGSVK